jgi:ribose 5-phosphate isomerase B
MSQKESMSSKTMSVGIAADHGGYELKEHLVRMLHEANFEVVDFGDRKPVFDDDYPDFIAPMAHAVGNGDVQRGVAICGSGVGASIAANRVSGVRACLIHETLSAHQGVEDDNINVICLGGMVVGHAMAWELVQTFLAATFTGADRHRRRLEKVEEIEAKAARTS